MLGIPVYRPISDPVKSDFTIHDEIGDIIFINLFCCTGLFTNCDIMKALQ